MIIRQLFMLLLIFNSTIVYSTNKFLIKDIQFNGLQRTDVSAALLYMPVRVGDMISRKDVKDIIRALFNSGFFEKVQVSFYKNLLSIKVKERPIINKITFSGNKIINNNILKKNLDSKGIRSGSIFNYSVIFNIQREIKEFYANIGQYNSFIKVEITPISYNRIDLKLIFLENRSAKIQKINIIGNHDFTMNELISNFHVRNNTPWWNIISNREYREQKFMEDIEKLRRFYLDRGYVHFNINSTQLELTPDKDVMYITLNIHEGKKYTVSNILVNMNVYDYLDKIKQLIGIKKGEIYNFTKVSNMENNIKKLLGCYGYIYPNINTQLKINETDKVINLYININVGNRFYVNQIIFEGNDITKDTVLRQEMQQTEGNLININLINQGKERLERLGYFENISVSIQNVSNSSNQVDVIYKVKERNFGSINFGMGVGSESGLSFQFNIQQENWMGTGNSVGIIGTKNDYQSYAEFSVIYPHFKMNNISLGGKIFYNNFSANEAELSNYNLFSYGANTILGVPIENNQSINLILDYMHNRITNMEPQVAMWRYLNSLGIYPKVLKNKSDNDITLISNDFFLSMNWNYNSFNHGYFPTSGSRMHLTGKVTLPKSSNRYYKIIFDYTSYFPISKSEKWILVNQTKIGYSNGFGRYEVPFYDNFYSGGSNTIRGFRTNTIGPKAVYYKCSENSIHYKDCLIEQSDDAIGGNSVITTKLEVIVPTPFLEQYSNLIRTSIFVDSGTVWDSNWKNDKCMQSFGIPDYSNFNNVRISSGVSLQWISPLGPLVFSYSQPIKKYHGDKPEQFQFSIGKTW